MTFEEAKKISFRYGMKFRYHNNKIGELLAVDFSFNECKVFLSTKTERSDKAFWLNITKVEILKEKEIIG